MTSASEPVNLRAQDESSWSSLVSKVVVTADMEIPKGQTFKGHIRTASISDLGIFTMTSRKHAAHRTAKHTSDRDPEIVLTLTKQGHLGIRQNGRAVDVPPGQFGIYVSYDPVEIISADNYQALAVKIPVSRCRAGVEQFRELSAQSFPADEGLAPAVWGMTEQLGGGANFSSRTAALRTAHHAIGMMEQMVHERLGEPAALAEPQIEAIAERCFRYIEKHLQDPELNPQRVAEANFISTRYLHLIFQQSDTTVAAYIRDRRLEEAREDLMDPKFHRFSIDALARKWGFNNVSHFGQLFKKTYGCPPAVYRREAFGC